MVAVQTSRESEVVNSRAMKSKQLCPGLQVTVACVVVLLLGFLAPQAESATNKTIQVGAGVGGSAGWTNTANFDYQAFISKYTIYVGDVLSKIQRQCLI